MKKVIIAGGSGSIGKLLTNTLVKNGYEVVILSRNPGQVKDLPKGARAVRWDAKTGTDWVEEANGAYAIINLAGENLAGPGFLPLRWTEARKTLIRQSRLDTGNAIVDAVRRAALKPEVVIQSSAVGYYGPRGSEVITEETEAGTDYLARICVEWEKSTQPVESLGVRHVVIRTGIYITPDDGALKRLLLPYKLFAGGPFGNGKQYYAWIHPTDEVEAIRFLIETPKASGAFNLASPRPVTNRDFGKALGKVLHRPSFIPVPAFALKLLVGEVSTVVLDGQRVVPQRLEVLGFKFQYPEIETAFRSVFK